MMSRKGMARLVGALSIGMGFPSSLSLTYFPARFLVPNDPAATAANIQHATSIYRLWAFADMISGFFAICLAIALYRLFKDVDRNWSRFVVGVLLVTVPMMFAITLVQLAAMTVLNGSSSWGAFDKSQLESLAYGFLTLRGLAVGAMSVYWGIWLIPVAVLIYRSGFLPRILGIVVGVAAVAYVTSAVVFFVAPGSYRTVFWAVSPIYGIGEASFVLYMLIKGGKEDFAITTVKKETVTR